MTIPGNTVFSVCHVGSRSGGNEVPIKVIRYSPFQSISARIILQTKISHKELQGIKFVKMF